MKRDEFLKLLKEKRYEFVDMLFTDIFGTMHHFTIPSSYLKEEHFEEGLGFDASSIRAWQAIHLSDMNFVPDPETAFENPFYKHPTISVIGNIIDPVTKQRYSRDPRYIATKAEMYLKSTGIGDTVYVGPELEFFIFDNVQFEYKENKAFHLVDSVEGWWRTGEAENPNLGYKIPYRRGYFPVPPHDTLQDIRAEIAATLQKIGITVEYFHHEVASGGQGEIDFLFAPLTKQADNVMLYKYVVKNIARKYGKTATFMPKPIFGDNGSGMHIHISIWKDGKPVFAGSGYAGLSQTALYFIGGIIKHGKALCAIVAPTTNSYRRLVPGYEAPVRLAYSSRNRSAGIRIPMYSASPATKRLEIRFPDPSSNPYLTFAAILMAGLDGIENRIDPGDPLDRDIYALPPEELADVPQTPGSLEEALNELEKDHDFLLKGDVFTEELLMIWIEWKRKECFELKIRPHPYEFLLYFDL